MPAGKRPQTNAILYTLIAFVGLFIVATAFAIIFYVKTEEQKDTVSKATEELGRILDQTEQNAGLSKIVGDFAKDKSAMGTMVNYLDNLYKLIIGTNPEDTTAKIKFETINTKVNDAVKAVPKDYLNQKSIEPNTLSMLRMIDKLKLKADLLTKAQADTENQLKELNARYDADMNETQNKEKNLLEQKEIYRLQVDNIQKEYNKLADLLKQDSNERVKMLAVQLEETRTNRDTIRTELLRTQAENNDVQRRMQAARDELMQIKPLPSSDAAAFKPDGKIVFVDDLTRTVHISLGSDDRVYQGLTFGVYDMSVPIPKDGKGKAEIEIFDVKPKVSIARIITPINLKQPIIVGDNIANLIWDSNETNIFVIAGDFDLNLDGAKDDYAADKIKTLIEKWGGKVAPAISIEVDYIILGSQPMVPRKPTFEEMETFPLAMQKYEEAVKLSSKYSEVLKQAELLRIPIFNYERFLYFTGYKMKAREQGSF